MTKCDLCMADIKSFQSTHLQEKWQVHGVEEVCRDCADEITDISMALDAKVAAVKDGIRKRLVLRLYEMLRRRREEPSDE